MHLAKSRQTEKISELLKVLFWHATDTSITAEIFKKNSLYMHF